MDTVLTSRCLRFKHDLRHAETCAQALVGYHGLGRRQQGFGVIFDRSIPPFALEHLCPAIDGILRRQGFSRNSIGRFICHPGGAKIVEAIEVVLSFKTGALDHERAILARFGNMSAPTALFVLERVMAAGLPPRSMLMALGPGFTQSTLTLARTST